MEDYPSISYRPIGIIRTPFSTPAEMPIQPEGAKGIKGTIEINPELAPGLFDIEGFSHLILIYHFHLIQGHKLYVVPFMDDKPHGIFATRAPVRPNPIGISVVELKKVENNLIYIEGVDMIDGTPLLDIKPFYARYDNRPETRSGWLEGKERTDISKIKSDARFDTRKCPESNRCK